MRNNFNFRFVWATFHYPSSTDEKGWITWPKPKRRLCIVRHGMIKGPEHTGFVPAGRGFRPHFRINDPLPLRPDDAKRLLERARP